MNDLLDRHDERTGLMLVVLLLTAFSVVLVFLLLAVDKNRVMADTGGYSVFHILESKYKVNRTDGYSTVRSTIGWIFLIGGVINLFIFIKGKVDDKRNLKDSFDGERNQL